MDNVNVVSQKLRRCFCENWFCELALLVLLAGTLWGQAASGAVGVSQDQTSHEQAPQDQAPAGEGARATPETIVSPEEAKELFRSVDEILQFASEDRACRSSTR